MATVVEVKAAPSGQPPLPPSCLTHIVCGTTATKGGNKVVLWGESSCDHDWHAASQLIEGVDEVISRAQFKMQEVFESSKLLAEMGAAKALASQTQIQTSRPFCQNGLQAKSEFGMCFDIGSKHLGAGAQTRHASNPE